MKALRFIMITCLCTTVTLFAAKGDPSFHVRGKLTYNGKPLGAAAVGIKGLNLTTFTNEQGEFDLYPVKRGQYALAVSHPKTKSESFDIFVKRDFRIDKQLGDDVPRLQSQANPPPFFQPTSQTYDTGDTVAKAATVAGLSPQYFTFLPSSVKMGVLFEPPVIRAQNPMNNAYVMDGLVMDMPFHTLGVFSTANLRYTDGVSVSRGVYSVTDRDAQGAALVETMLPAGRDAQQRFQFYINPVIADGAAHYQISDKAWGTVSVRRTLLEGYFDTTSPVPSAADYQTKNVVRLGGRNQLELTAFGADSSIPFPFTSKQFLSSRAHAQKLKYRHEDGNLTYELELKNRYATLNYLVFSSQKNITSLTPRLGYYFARDQYAEVGTDLFYEGRSAQILQAQSLGDIDLSQLKNYSSGGYDAGNGFAMGGYLKYRGRFGRFGAEASARLDKYREYDGLYSANALQLFYEFVPNGKIYAGAANMHRRPDAFKSIALLSSPALAPESNVKAEAGVGFNPLKFLKLSVTVFYTRWSNIIALRSDTATATDITNTNIYYNAGSSENTGIELGGVLQLGKYYLRSSYTYQHMPAGDNYSFYYRRHVGNAAFIYSDGAMSHTVQLKVWSLPTDIDGSRSDALNPVVQLDYRWMIQSDTGVFFTAEVGQILTPAWKYLADPHRNEYQDTAAIGNSFMATPNRSKITDEIPIHGNIAAGIKL